MRLIYTWDTGYFSYAKYKKISGIDDISIYHRYFYQWPYLVGLPLSVICFILYCVLKVLINSGEILLDVLGFFCD